MLFQKVYLFFLPYQYLGCEHDGEIYEDGKQFASRSNPCLKCSCSVSRVCVCGWMWVWVWMCVWVWVGVWVDVGVGVDVDVGPLKTSQEKDSKRAK